MLPIIALFAGLSMIFPPAVAALASIVAAVFMIFIQMRFAFYVYPIVDVKMGAIDALTRSWRITKGSVLRLIIFNIILGLLPVTLAVVAILNFVGALAVVSRGWYLAAVLPALLVVAALFVLALLVPVIFLANVYAYKKLVEHAANNNGVTPLHPE
jgi:hypothetical protein